MLSRRECLGSVASAVGRAIAGCASDGIDRTTPDADEVVNRWLDRHEDKEQRAVENFSRGNELFRAEDFGRAMTFFERALNLYEDLETSAKDRDREFDNGTRANELFSLLGQYYFFMREASLWRHSAAFEIAVNNDRGAADRALERSVFRFERAEELKQEFQAKLRD